MKKLYFTFLIVLFTFFQCEKQTINPEPNIDAGNISFKINLGMVPSDVSAVGGYLSRSNYDSIFFNFQVTGNTADAIVENIIHGRWKLTVNAMDSSGVVIYSGSVDVQVDPGIINQVSLQLDPTTGSLEIIVTWGGPTVQDSSLIAFYPFNGNANDESGNGFHGTVYGATLVNDHHGIGSRAYSFDGYNDFINIGDVDELRIYGDLTISLWMYVRSFQGKGGIITCQADNSDDPNTNAIYKVNFAYTNWFHYCHESGPGIDFTHDFTNFSFNANNWHHTTLVRKINEKALNLFVDGSLVETYYYALNPDNGDLSTVKIGENHGSIAADRFFNGILDEIRIYNRALIEQEIQALYQSGK